MRVAWTCGFCHKVSRSTHANAALSRHLYIRHLLYHCIFTLHSRRRRRR